ncbi:MAG: class I tRNA ligase family protein, partial [Clostridia bacterium]|nr:class I tRNA ligase family protein [Clostridia bacterium]
TVEPIASRQWFVKMAPLAKPAIEAVESGEIKFVPERFSKIYINWMNNIHDWCISRQLWWGHRIPAYYCADCGEMVVSTEAVGVCPKCGSKNMSQDEDVLDTWFSSALWPFSTLGWPKKTADLDYFYPTTTLVTAYDIIFFWVARMIFSGIEHTGKAPFGTVFIHGLVRDSQGRKMSKSLGNGIDPLKVIEQYGADALRFALATNNSPGNDMRFSDEKVEASRNFANKLWNAARFVLMNLHSDETALPQDLTLDDKWILSKLNNVVADVTANIDKFELGIALDKVYSFIWDDFCDWYIELAKIRLFAGGEQAAGAERVLVYVLDKILKLLHPFMPFITEEIWQSIPHEGKALVIAPWPEYSAKLNFASDEEDMNLIMAAIKEIRAKRAAMNIPLSKKAALFIETDKPETFARGAEFFKRLAGVSETEIERELSVANALTMVVPSAKLMIPMNELVDPEKERARLNKEKAATENEITRCESRLNNEGFISKAPAKLIEDERKKLASLKEMLEKINDSLTKLGEIK